MNQLHKTYEVTVSGFPPVTYSARNPSHARANAWRDYTSAYNCPFKDFLRISSVRRCAVPEDDGYAYVRRAYGVKLAIGQRVRLKNEWKMTGKCGTILYPGKHSAHVAILLDGNTIPLLVHPNNFEPADASLTSNNEVPS